MCYYVFFRYQCGCAPLEPVLVSSGSDCPTSCADKTPPLDFSPPRYLSYNCNNCQVTREMNGRPRPEQDFRPAERARGGPRGSGRGGLQAATREPPAVGRRTKDATSGSEDKKKKQEERAAAARWRQWDRERAAEEEEERQKDAKGSKGAKKGGRK